MEQLVELLGQIQDLAGVGIDALKKASGGQHMAPEREGGAPQDKGPSGQPDGGGQPHRFGGAPADRQRQ